MQASKLIDYLKALDSSELRKFRKFISSEYHNTNEKVVRLFDFLRKHHPEFDSPRLKKESVIKKLFPEFKKDGVKKFSYVTSDMFKLLEDFMIDQELTGDEVARQRTYVSALSRRQLYKHTLLQIEKGEELLANKKPIDHNHYYEYYRLYEIGHQVAFTEIHLKGNKVFEELMLHLDLFYFTTKMKYGLVMLDRERIFNEKANILMLEEIVKYTQTPPFSDNILLKTYDALYRMLNKESEVERTTAYFQLKGIYFDNLEVYKIGDQANIGILLQNYCQRMAKGGNRDFLRELWSLNDESIRKNIYESFDQGQHFVFFNAIQVGCELGEYAWAEEILVDFIHIIPEGKREETKGICFAYLYCCEGKYEEVLELLRDYLFEEFYYVITTKYLTLRVYYEQGHDYAFFNFTKTLMAYIRRHTQMSEQMKEANLNFVKFAERLFRNKREKKYAKEELQIKLNELPNIAYRSWLERKIIEC